MTPSERADGDDVGRRPADHRLRLGADGQGALRPVSMATTLGSEMTIPLAHVDERVGRAEVDAEVAAEEAEQGVEESQAASRVRLVAPTPEETRRAGAAAFMRLGGP